MTTLSKDQQAVADYESRRQLANATPSELAPYPGWDPEWGVKTASAMCRELRPQALEAMERLSEDEIAEARDRAREAFTRDYGPPAKDLRPIRARSKTPTIPPCRYFVGHHDVEIFDGDGNLIDDDLEVIRGDFTIVDIPDDAGWVTAVDSDGGRYAAREPWAIGDMIALKKVG